MCLVGVFIFIVIVVNEAASVILFGEYVCVMDHFAGDFLICRGVAGGVAAREIECVLDICRGLWVSGEGELKGGGEGLLVFGGGEVGAGEPSE